jgi:hypothetical protein
MGIFPALKVPMQFPIVLLVNVGCKEVKALGSVYATTDLLYY